MEVMWCWSAQVRPKPEPKPLTLNLNPKLHFSLYGIYMWVQSTIIERISHQIAHMVKPVAAICHAFGSCGQPAVVTLQQRSWSAEVVMAVWRDSTAWWL
jgi:hypothetical protein